MKYTGIPDPYPDVNPSTVTDEYWLFAERQKGSYPNTINTLKNGKWLIFVKIEEVDEVWKKVKRATEEGKLGLLAKVSTAKPNQNATNQNTKVICVYTHDWTDVNDVRGIREELRKLGITQKIPYKTDEDTVSGKYVVRGSKNISKYYE